MFDWDDQELTNIIWGEPSETDDHIVPYPEENEKKNLLNYGNGDRKKLNEEDTNSKASEQNTPASKPYSDGHNQENNDGVLASGVVADPQLELPSFATSKTENNAIAKKSQLDIDPGILQSQQEDKDLGELVGNSWANIGSFDDLDRIFSNDDLDDHASLGSGDDLWPLSKVLISGAAKPSSQALDSTSWEFGTLGNSSPPFEINSVYLRHENQSLTPSCLQLDASSPFSQRNIGSCVEQVEYALDMTGLVKEKTASGKPVKAKFDSHLVSKKAATLNKPIDKDNWLKNHLKHVRRSDKITNPIVLRDPYDTWPSSAADIPHYGSQCTLASAQNYQVTVPSQKQLPQDSNSLPYPHFSNQYVSPYAYGNFTLQHPAVHMPKPQDDDHQSVLTNSESCPSDVISLNKPADNFSKPVNMSPQEKIEKLRRRQKMRAMLAIQKQQQQLGQKPSHVDYTLSQNSCNEDQDKHMEKADFVSDENLSGLPCYDPGSPNKMDDSSTISDIDDFSAEDTVLCQLQDVIARLDLKIRLCVRDSLYRLAQSATQRSYTSDTSSTNKTGTYGSDVAKEEISSHDRSTGNENMETETNQIDRIVAHLLFHRPFKLSVKQVETPESSTSTKVSIEQETATPSSLPTGFNSKNPENEYNLSPHGSKTSNAYGDSCDRHSLNDVPQRGMRMNQKMTEHED